MVGSALHGATLVAMLLTATAAHAVGEGGCQVTRPAGSPAVVLLLGAAIRVLARRRARR